MTFTEARNEAKARFGAYPAWGDVMALAAETGFQASVTSGYKPVSGYATRFRFTTEDGRPGVTTDALHAAAVILARAQ